MAPWAGAAEDGQLGVLTLDQSKLSGPALGADAGAQARRARSAAGLVG